MLRKINLLLLIAGTACAPKVTTQITSRQSPSSYKQEIRVFNLSESIPNCQEVGTVSVSDNGFSTNCGYEQAIEKAKLEARKAGGNAIKIIEHRTPSAFGSSCHRIKAKILIVEDLESIAKTQTENTLGNVNYAIIHVYRHSGAGAAIGYDLYLGDSVIWRAKNNSKGSIKVLKNGRNTLWAKTESKEEIPINIKFGNEYFLRCGISMGIMVGRPTLQLVDYNFGKSEFESSKLKINK